MPASIKHHPVFVMICQTDVTRKYLCLMCILTYMYPHYHYEVGDCPHPACKDNVWFLSSFLHAFSQTVLNWRYQFLLVTNITCSLHGACKTRLNEKKTSNLLIYHFSILIYIIECTIRKCFTIQWHQYGTTINKDQKLQILFSS